MGPTKEPEAEVRRVTLVTGGTGALGRAVVRRFLEAGARVHVPVFAEEEVEALEGELGDAFDAVHLHRGADLTDPDSVAGVFRAVEEGEGRPPEILLNLAGGFTAGPIAQTNPRTWKRMLDLNATTAFLCSRAAFPGMRVRSWGRIVNVAAFPALERGGAGMAAYAAAKAAVLSLTRSLAKEGVAHGITVNAILPSIIDTPANRDAMPDAETATWLDPAEIAGVVHFLASPRARIVNGAAITLTLD